MEGDTLIQSYPWISWNLFDTLSENTSHTPIMDEIENKKICGYYDGWLIVKGSNNKHYIINAQSLDTIRLPSLSFRFKYTTCVLTRSPSDFGCHVLFLAKNAILYCKPGDKKFQKFKLKKGMLIKSDLVAVLEGKVYCLDSQSWDFSVIKCNESVEISKIECSSDLFFGIGTICYQEYLVECGGELLLVVKFLSLLRPKEDLAEIDCFRVFRFDFLNNLWMKVDNIGEFTIFLAREHRSGISLRAVESRINQNSLCFLDRKDEFIHVYDLENRSLMIHSDRLKGESLHLGEESNDYEKRNEEFLPQLPSEVSKLILDRTFTVDPGALGYIRSTCKNWRSIVRPPTSDIDLRYSRYPYLVTLINATCKFFHPTYDHTFCLDTPELVDARIMFSKYGWLLLSQVNEREGGLDRCFFFNPFTRQKINLPGCIHEFMAMSFSSPPTSSDGFVVGVANCGCILTTYKYGESEWSMLERLPFRKRVMNYPPIFRKQKCCCIGADKKLIIVDLNTGNTSTVRNTFPKELELELEEVKECFLVEDKKGTLFGVFLVTRRKIPRLMRIVKVSRTNILWESVENLKNKMIYVSPASTCLVSAPTTSTSNKIYFPLFRNSNNIFYSLFTRKYHSYLGNYSCDTPFGVQRKTNCAWIDVEL